MQNNHTLYAIRNGQHASQLNNPHIVRNAYGQHEWQLNYPQVVDNENNNMRDNKIFCTLSARKKIKKTTTKKNMRGN